MQIKSGLSIVRAKRRNQVRVLEREGEGERERGVVVEKEEREEGSQQK